MRYTDYLNDWYFKRTDEVPEKLDELDDSWSLVEVPHTWNNWDGQDGGADYYRGKGAYTLELVRPDVPEDHKIYLEFQGVNSVAEVYANGEKLTEHRGGYSTFRVDISDHFTEDETTITVVADNSHFDDVYPQSADFTFYGGMYRPVQLITVPDTHFDLDFYGSLGITYKTQIDLYDAKVQLNAWITNPQSADQIHFEIADQNGEIVNEAYVPAEEVVETITSITEPHLWQGVEDPYLYELTASIWRGNECLDIVSTSLGIREFYVDPEEGFFLNGKKMPLRGVAKHQDFMNRGNAVGMEHLIEDAQLIQEIGANTVRLAHYQHPQDFYELCDAFGFVVWAEIPFISVFNEDPDARENTISQMKELIYQNYNHASILFWGIGNELTIGGDSPELVDNLKELNELTKEIDPTRLTTMAQLNNLPMDSEHNEIADVISYNIYYGWYMGQLEDSEKFMDKFHEENPDIPLGISEYGTEGIISWHTDEPKNQDYTEEYHALYHEHMAKVLDERDFIWSSHVWNMFDFGADNRDEGGIAGRNNKGLVTFDRQTRKDAFYIYKAYWSDEPFVHITGKRYAQRPYDEMTVKVYSNLDTLTLLVDGEEFAEVSSDKIFEFENVPLENQYTTLTVMAEPGVYDSVTFEKVSEPNPNYVLPEEEEATGEGVRNWFEEETDKGEPAPEMTFDEDHFSVKDKVKDVLGNEDAKKVLLDTVSAVMDMNIKPTTLAMLNESPVSKLGTFLGGEDEDEETEMMKWLNAGLQEIEK